MRRPGAASTPPWPESWPGLGPAYRWGSEHPADVDLDCNTTASALLVIGYSIALGVLGRLRPVLAERARVVVRGPRSSDGEHHHRLVAASTTPPGGGQGHGPCRLRHRLADHRPPRRSACKECPLTGMGGPRTCPWRERLRRFAASATGVSLGRRLVAPAAGIRCGILRRLTVRHPARWWPGMPGRPGRGSIRCQQAIARTCACSGGWEATFPTHISSGSGRRSSRHGLSRTKSRRPMPTSDHRNTGREGGDRRA